MAERFGRGVREDAGVSGERKLTDNRKQSIYLGEELLQSVKEEAARLDRSISWVIQRALKLSLPEIKKLPGMGDADPTSEPNDGTESDEA
jgi:uncharacterized small protein (TIGR04563 family)